VVQVFTEGCALLWEGTISGTGPFFAIIDFEADGTVNETNGVAVMSGDLPPANEIQSDRHERCPETAPAPPVSPLPEAS
jgi:hypothetical protein